MAWNDGRNENEGLRVVMTPYGVVRNERSHSRTYAALMMKQKQPRALVWKERIMKLGGSCVITTLQDDGLYPEEGRIGSARS